MDSNKKAFIIATTEEMVEPQKRRGRDSSANILRILKATFKNTQKLTEDQELYLKKVLTQLEEGGLPQETTKNTLKALNSSMLFNRFFVKLINLALSKAFSKVFLIISRACCLFIFYSLNISSSVFF